jgi:enoyl-CoA hydratase/carnithine racemase
MGGSIARVVAAHDRAVLTLTLANEERANALTSSMLDDLARALGGIPPDVRVVLLTGAGDRNFSSGVDLGDAPTPHRLRESEARLGAAVDALRECPVPVVAALNGSAYGGALELAMACDWRIAREGATFAMPPGRLGVVYSPRGLQLFVAAIGPARTAEIFLTGAPVDAHRALEMGLVNAVHDAAELGARARDSAESVAAMAPIAVRGTIATIRALAAGPLSDDGREIAQAWRDRAYASADLTEGLAAFRERRPPGFSGD